MVNQIIADSDRSDQTSCLTETILENKSPPCTSSSTILQPDPNPTKQSTNISPNMIDDQENDVSRQDMSNDNLGKNTESNSGHNDFVIRDGFPALGLPGNLKRWNITDPEPIPANEFNVSSSLLQPRQNKEVASLPEDETWKLLHHDASTVFTARTKDDSAAYSIGTTYFSPCQMEPRCQLEEIVQSIFKMHTKHLAPGIIIPEQSGSEWWTLVMDTGKSNASSNDNIDENDDSEEDDDDDDVGMHFDADYGLEEQVPNLLLHPRLATVTYLTDFGTPTLILDQRSPPPADKDKKTLEGSIRKGWLSHPIQGKHIAFDGRLLHGAPSTFFPQVSGDSNGIIRKAVPRVDEPPNKKAKISDEDLPREEPLHQKRITLLVNIWINHCPLDAEPLDDEIIMQLKMPFAVKAEEHHEGDKTNDDSSSMFQWNDAKDCSTLPLEIPKVSVKAAKLSSSPPPPLRTTFDDDDSNDEVDDDVEPAGEEEIVVGGRLVTISYGATLRDFHHASMIAAQSKDSLRCAELELNREVIAVTVGEIVEDSDSDSGSSAS